MVAFNTDNFRSTPAVKPPSNVMTLLLWNLSLKNKLAGIRLSLKIKLASCLFQIESHGGCALPTLHEPHLNRMHKFTYVHAQLDQESRKPNLEKVKIKVILLQISKKIKEKMLC